MEPRKQAEESFEKAVKEEREVAVLASHASSKSTGLMRVKIGNFPPNSVAIITCFMYSELTYERPKGYVFRLPLTYVPKYMLGNEPGSTTGETASG